MLSAKRFLKIASYAGLFAIAFLFSSGVQAQCLQTNIAAGKTVVTNIALSYAPGSNITDGDMNTSWAGDVDGTYWAYVDLGQAYPLCKAVVKWYLNSSSNSLKIQASNTGNNDWVDLVTVSTSGVNMADNSYTYHTIDLSSISTSYRYVRLYIPFSAAWGPKVREFEIYVKPVNLPTVSITAPLDGANYTQGNNITISANASETDGTISKVEYYQGTTKLGEDASYPYSFTWNNVTAGDYLLKAIAYDAAGQTATSSQVEIWVDLPVNSWALNGNVNTTTTNFLGTTDNKPLIIKTNGLERLRITADGKIGINTGAAIPTDSAVALAINGQVYARKLKITQASWADYVFHRNYRLRPLGEVEKYINTYHRLPDLPSATAIEKHGVDVGDAQALLLQKIEELTLYMIQVNKDVQKLKQENTNMKKQLAAKKK